jgi:hydrogenase maturation protein HypF
LEAAASNSSEELRVKSEEFWKASLRDAFHFEKKEGQTILDWEPLVRRLAEGDDTAVGGFIPVLAELIASVSGNYPDLPIVLSGGVFQNRTLCEAVLPKLESRKVLLPRHTPVNDGAVALGQLWYALHKD